MLASIVWAQLDICHLSCVSVMANRMAIIIVINLRDTQWAQWLRWCLGYPYPILECIVPVPVPLLIAASCSGAPSEILHYHKVFESLASTQIRVVFLSLEFHLTQLQILQPQKMGDIIFLFVFLCFLQTTIIKIIAYSLNLLELKFIITYEQALYRSQFSSQKVFMVFIFIPLMSQCRALLLATQSWLLPGWSLI